VPPKSSLIEVPLDMVHETLNEHGSTDKTIESQ
jgi:hypothetical protein